MKRCYPPTRRKPRDVWEREDAVLYATREGRSAIAIAAELLIAERSVVRIRRRLRQEGRAA